MRIKQILESTVAGSVATVAKPLGEVQKRPNVPEFQATKKKKGPYANSLSESKMKDLAMDLKSGPDGLTDEEFKKKYGKSKAEMRKNVSAKKPEPKKVEEAKLDEEDKIIAPGKGNKIKPGLLNKPEISVNPVDSIKIDIPLLIRLLEYAREDANSDMDLHDLAEKLVQRGVRGKTLTMKDYDFVVESLSGGVIAGGGVGEGKVNEKAVSKAQQKFFGMAHAMQKGKKIPGASKELKDVAKSMGKKDVKDYAQTKHKGLPQHVAKKD